MPTTKSVYDRLADNLGAPGSKRFARILKAMMTAEEAQILLEAPNPTTAKEIAKKLKTDEKSLQVRLDDMEQRQIIRKFQDKYITPANIVAFHHGAIGWMSEDLKARVYPLWGDFFFAEWRDILVDGFIQRKQSGAPGAHRVVPAYKALRASPNIKPEQILWYEDMEQIIKKAERRNVMMCGCRGLWRKCEHTIDTCFQVQFPTAGPPRVREANEFIKPPKDLTCEEALKLISDCEDEGLVHIPLNTSHGDLFCNCCDDCCMVINPLLHRGEGTIWEILSPSRYRAVVNEELCGGCQTCFKRCKFGAIEMKPVPGSKKMKSSIISEHCLGCGVCVVKCPKNALTLELIRPPEHIPTVSVLDLFRWGQGTKG
jgi:Pyruvate/2-oxoacid:ferredoxin oxidoreductase delta subunit/DNA-binding Lrp family transcriptional regulator